MRTIPINQKFYITAGGVRQNFGMYLWAVDAAEAILRADDYARWLGITSGFLLVRDGGEVIYQRAPSLPLDGVDLRD